MKYLCHETQKLQKYLLSESESSAYIVTVIVICIAGYIDYATYHTLTFEKLDLKYHHLFTFKRFLNKFTVQIFPLKEKDFSFLSIFRFIFTSADGYLLLYGRITVIKTQTKERLKETFSKITRIKFIRTRTMWS